MGISFLVANIDKKQYIDPAAFGGGNLRRYFQGDHTVALAMLTCNAEGVGIGPPAGSWWRDRVVAVMDCAPPNEFGINTKTEEEPGRNLYMMAWQEFEDVSYDAMAILCEWSDAFADRVATRLQQELELGMSPSHRNPTITSVRHAATVITDTPWITSISRSTTKCPTRWKPSGLSPIASHKRLETTGQMR
jgi:hypothetical protein